ncbi:MAG: ATP-dependent DNA helicase UvrD2 [Nostocoides sp.]
MTGSGTAVGDVDAILVDLDPEQREVATRLSGPICVLAGAGTGKTRAITHRIAYGVLSGVYQPQRVLAVTFTARAAGEMRTRLRDLGVGGAQARTFHAAALRQLHYFWPQAIGGAAPEVIAAKASAVAEAAGRLRLSFDRAAIRDLAAEIEWAKVSMLTAETYAAAARAAGREPPGVDRTAMARLLDAYEEVKGARNVIDFEDVLLLTVGILEERADIAATVREQYRHFVVDEYQDVNALQQRLLTAWLGGREELCVVGDPAQTIYSFTGATPRHLLDFPKEHPGAAVVHLVRNYRSTPEVVRLANVVLAGAGAMASSGPPSSGGSTSPGTRMMELIAQSEPGPPPVLRNYPDDPAEAAGVAEQIAALAAQGESLAQIAILFRTNAQSEAFEAALAERDIPYLVRGGERFFRRTEVREAILLMRGQARADDGSQPLPDLVRDLLVGAGWTRTPPSGGAQRERWESLAALAALAEDVIAVTPQARLPDLLRDLDERAAAQHAPAVQGVTLASLHAAKGLEWDTVFLAGCSDGFIPITMAEGAEAIAEERRLLYVGLTRARRGLVLSFASARTPGARATRRPSRFLDRASALLGDQARSRSARAGSARAHGGRVRRARPSRPATCRSCGAELTTAAQRVVGRCQDCPATYDAGVYERLKAWRLETSRQEKVPAFVVFSDATLTAIAEQTPRDEAGLAAITGVGTRKLAKYGPAVLALLDSASEGAGGAAN